MSNFDASTAKIVGAEFLFSVPQMPVPDEAVQPEIAFFGRSNAGKSTLLNELCNQKQLARVSKTPGRTGALNYFRVQMHQGEKSARFRWECNFVDTPGYGYAKTAGSERKRWNQLMLHYLTERELLRAIVLAIDCRREVAEEELWIREQAGPRDFLVVLTKADQVNRRELDARRRAVEQDLGLRPDAVFTTGFIGKQRREPADLRLTICQIAFPDL